jgi:hypothetical protein
VFEALEAATGCVRLMFETYNTGQSGFGYSRGIFQNVCPDPEDFVRQGIKFLLGFIAKSRKGAVT